MKIFITLTILLATVLTLVTISCSKDKGSCYEEQLYQNHKNDFCTADCPGVAGCDGKTYCNECVANRQGIRKK